MTDLLSASQQGRSPVSWQPEDVELVTRLAERDMDAMSVLYDRYAAMVNGLALRITGHPADAAEVVQETFTQVWRQAASYEPGRGSVVSWLCMIARTRALDLIRTRSRRPVLESDSSADEGPQREAVDPSQTPETQVLANEGVAAVKRALTELTGPERLALELAYYEDLSHSEIAARTGLPLGTVKTHISRAVRKLRLALTASEGQEASRS